MINSRRVKLFEEKSIDILEESLNEWLETTSNSVESISYSASRDAYSALVYYRLLPPSLAEHRARNASQRGDEHKTEPLFNNETAC